MLNSSYYSQPVTELNQPNVSFVNNTMSINAVFQSTAQNFRLQPAPQQDEALFARLLGVLIGNLLVPPVQSQPKSNNLFSTLLLLVLKKCGRGRRRDWNSWDAAPPPPPLPPSLPSAYTRVPNNDRTLETAQVVSGLMWD
jgi:hypothetical protein